MDLSNISVKKIVLIVFAVIAGGIIFFRTVYSINEQTNGIVMEFGKPIRVETAGFHVKGFWQSLKRVDMTTHGTGIGYTVTKDGQNITDTDNGIMITSDFNLLNIDFYLEYRVSDPIAFKFNSEDPEGILSNIAMASIRTVVSNYTIDDAMTTQKGQIQAEIKEAMLKRLENYDIGLTVVNITVQDAAPPTEEIIAAFKNVESAKQGKDTAVNNAKKYQNEELPKAEADADKILQDAEAYKQARIKEAEGQVARFNEMYEQYKLQPYITKKRLFYEKMEEILPTVKVIITDGKTQTMLPVDSFTNGGN